MRMRLSRAVYFGASGVAVLIVWFMIQQRNPVFTKTCERPLTFQNNLLNLSYRVHKVLDIMSVPHCLCYGALWGQVRRSSTLPWESDVEFCVINKELEELDENFVDLLFKKHNLTLVYDSAEGEYSVSDESSQRGALIKLVLFEEDSKLDIMRRIGWKRRMLPPNCDDSKSLDCFPVRLVRRPLPLKSFGWKQLPVPWESLEILKYHYPDNWWLEAFPLNC